MPQLLLQGFPEGAIRIGPRLSVLEKEGTRTYFVGPDNSCSHPVGDAEKGVKKKGSEKGSVQ